MKMKNITLIKVLTLVAIIIGCVSCFKEEKQGTLLKIAMYSKNVESDEPTKTTTQVDSYAFYVKEGSKWEVSTWEDALNHRITNKDYPSEQLSAPDVIGSFDPAKEYQIELGLWSEHAFIVVVDLKNKVYATRLYETPMNLPETPIQLHLYAHKKSGQANGWDTVNPFPDEEREPLTPTEDEPTEEENEEQVTE